MLKTHEKSISFFQKAVDVALSVICWWLSNLFRFSYLKNSEFEGITFKLALPLAFLTYYFFARASLYKSRRLSSLSAEIFSLVRANFFALVAFLVFVYFINETKFSRGAILGYYFISTFTFCISRIFLRKFLRYIRSNGKNIRNVILVGHGDIIDAFVATLVSMPNAGLSLKGWIDSDGLAQKFGIPEVDAALNIDELRSHYSPDYIMVSYPGASSLKVDEFLKRNYNDVIPLAVLPDFRYSFVGLQLETLAGFPALVVNQPDFSAIDTVGKRALDIVLSGVGLILMLPSFIVIGILIKLDSPGPIFFGQNRVGLDRLKFKMWKFRSMQMDAETISLWTTKNDPRRTRLGKFLRATSLDELPQLWNVFVGEMSLVGPRPEQPHLVEKFRNEIPAYMLRHKMKAGITGWAQVNGWRGDTSLRERIECDLYYVRNWSNWLDMKILLLTLWRGFVNKNAY